MYAACMYYEVTHDHLPAAYFFSAALTGCKKKR